MGDTAERLCSHCRFPLPASDSGLRHYGTHTAHQENECLRILHAEIERLRAALQWLEDKARARKLEIAPSLLGKGFEFGFWPKGEARVVNAKTLLEAVEAAQRPNAGGNARREAASR